MRSAVATTRSSCFSQQLIEAEIAQQADLDAIHDEVEQVVEQSIEFADNSPVPDPNTIYDHIYANGNREPGTGNRGD